MSSNHEELTLISNLLKQGQPVSPVSIRTFLSWFDAQRRTKRNTEYIDKELAKEGIKTNPSYMNTWVDNIINFEIAQEAASSEEADSASFQADLGEKMDEAEEGIGNKSPNDPSFRIGNLAAASNTPESIKPNAPLKEAITIMIAGNYSQLPVMTSDREVKGVIKWSTIGLRLAANKGGADAQSFMEEHHEIPASASLFAGLRIILEQDYVLVRSNDRRISGIVTPSDIAYQFEEFSTPFMLLAEIENYLRQMVSQKLSVQDIKKACGEEHLPKAFKEVSDLTFGNFVRIIDHPENWIKIGLSLDRSAFMAQIIEINSIRNDVMHFDPDPLTPKDLTRLRNVAKLLGVLKAMNDF